MLFLFFLLWIIFNGRVTLEIVLFGVGVSALMFFFICRYMGFSIRKELRVYSNLFFALRYALTLVLEIIKANFCVMKLIISSKYEVEPVLVKFRTDLKQDTSRVALANSITLTPGTITITLEEDEYLIHCLDKDMAEGMEDSIFVKQLRELENRREKKV